MSVLFKEVVFQNKNNIDVTVHIDAPVGSAVIAGQVVAANQTATIVISKDDCASVAITAADRGHGEYKQTFALTPPGSGRASYLETVTVQYTIGDFKGGLTARTSG